MTNNKSLEDIFAAANAEPTDPQSPGDGSGIEEKDPPVNGDIDDKGEGDGDNKPVASNDDGNNNDDGHTSGGEPGGEGSDPDDLGDHSEIFSSLFLAVMEQAGLEDQEVPKTPEELVEKLAGIISDNAKPSFSSPISEQFDAYIRDGGTLESFIAEHSDDLEALPSIKTDEEKITVIAGVLAEAGFSRETIIKKIDKYIENDTLDDEAHDALGVIANKRNEAAKRRAEERKAAEAAREADAKQFFKNVESEIINLKEVRGIKITKAQTKELMDYCLKVDKSDGLTGYQRDYAKSPVSNFIESAFFTKYGTAMIKAAEGAGSSSAVEKFKQSLKNQKISGNTKVKSNPKEEMADWVKLASAFTGRK